MYKVHLDTDLGGDIDDLCALVYLLKRSDVEFTGITTVSDNAGKRAGYVKYILNVAGRSDIPVKSGADASSGHFRLYCGLPEEKEYWPEPVDPSLNLPEEALDLLKASIDEGATIIGIGPYTNLFLLDQRYPGILQQARIFLMGGYMTAIRKGFPLWTNETDWNIQIDVKSALYVLEHANPTLVPLSVTIETALRRSYLPDLRRSGKIGEIIAMQAEAHNTIHKNEETYGVTCPGLPPDILNFQHDPLTVAIATGWMEGVTIAEFPLQFQITDTYLRELIIPGGKKTRVIKSINNNAFNEHWLHVVTKGI